MRKIQKKMKKNKKNVFWVLTFSHFRGIIIVVKNIFSKWRKKNMKATGFRVIAVLFILLGVAAGVVAFVATDAAIEGILALILSVALGVVISFIFFAIAANKEKRERIRASMEAVENATVLDPIEEPAVEDIVLDEEIPNFEEIPDFNATEEINFIEEPAEIIEDAPKKYHPAYQYVRDKIVEKTPVTNEQIDKAEKIGKIAIPVAAVATVALMAAKLVSYRKNETRRRTFFDWLG
jgi:hypothetical protein